MSEKLSCKQPNVVPNKMRLYATWVDRTPPNCIPRLCTLTITRLTILKPLGLDVSAVSIAVKMQSSKRTLRTNEIQIPTGYGASGLLETPLDVTFTIQYPHFLKRDGNRLLVLLQRRKRYKNRTMLGYKTIAEGTIRMDQILQRPSDKELELYTGIEGGQPKEHKLAGVVGPANGILLARLSLMQLTSTAVLETHTKTIDSIGERDADMFNSDDDDLEISSGDQDEELCICSDGEQRVKLPRHNLKQRFVALLKRFKFPDGTDETGRPSNNDRDIQALFQELESLSCTGVAVDDDDSGPDPDFDSISVSSTPKPSLRPFFSSSKSLLLDNQDNDGCPNEDQFDECVVSDPMLTADNCSIDAERHLCGDVNTEMYADNAGSPQTVVKWGGDGANGSEITTPTQSTINAAATLLQEFSERRSKLFARSSLSQAHKRRVNMDQVSNESNTVRKLFLEHVNCLLSTDENVSMPDVVVLLMLPELVSVSLRLTYRHFQPVSAAEVKTVLNAVFNRIQKFCCTNTSPAGGSLMKLVLIGGDTLIGWVIRSFVELLSSRPNEWMNLIRLYIIPVGVCGITKQLAALDPGYSCLFPYEGCQQKLQDIKIDELQAKIHRYINAPSSAPLAQLPIAEVMITCQEDSNHFFVPFINEVRVGPSDNAQTMSTDFEDVQQLQAASSSSNTATSSPSSQNQQQQISQAVTPPSSPNMQSRDVLIASTVSWDPPLDLQLDYWLFTKTSSEQSNKVDNKPLKQDGKTSIKGLFKGIQAQPSSSSGLHINIHLATKEKKQKIMRLGKKKEKDKESEPRSHSLEGVSRLICSSRASHNQPMRVYVDGVEYGGVKFFQLSSTWQTHVKHLSVALVGVPLANDEMR